MKFIKKAAALCFCAALALSVMAITALADDEAELLEAPTLNKDFTVTLTKTTNTVLNRDSDATGVDDNGFEINAGDSVAYDISLVYDYSGNDTAPYNAGASKINSLQFDVELPAGVRAAVKINDESVPVPTVAGYTSTFAYSALGSASRDFTLPGSDSADTVVATITFTFSASAQQNKPLLPAIRNILLKIDNKETTEKVAVAVEGDNNDLAEAVINVGTPIWVNPQYVATVEHFEAAEASGIISKNSTNKTYVVYDYSSGTGSASAAALSSAPTWIDSNSVLTRNKLENPAAERFPGYTFKGWMVTTENASDTWAAYTGSSWTKDKFYATSNPTAQTGWTYLSGSSGDNLTTSATADYSDSNPVPVNFIPATVDVSTGIGSATIPAGYVGNITLTPVYQLDEYTATFNAGAHKAAFHDANTSATLDNTTRSYQYTKTYTIEDLYDTTNTRVADFLDIQCDPTKTTQNGGLARLGFKFVGWTMTGTSASGIQGGYSTDTAYDWSKDGTGPSAVITSVTNGQTRVNNTSVITTAVAKRYGDVTFTAEWELDIYFAKIDYTYAGKTTVGNDEVQNCMILVGVPKGTSREKPSAEAPNRIAENYDKDYNYTYKCKDVAGSEQAMFKIPDEVSAKNPNAQANSAETINRAVYVTKAIGTNGNTYFTAANLTDSYDIYAYIAPATTEEKDISLDDEPNISGGETNKTANATLHYDGDVDDTSVDQNPVIIDVGDFGNVDILYRSISVEGYTSEVFRLNTPAGVKARLQADYNCTDGDNAAFATIADILDIYNIMGYNKSSSQAPDDD